MYLMHENLARAHMDALQDEARSHAQANRLSRAARLQRRADQLAQRAQQASARLH